MKAKGVHTYREQTLGRFQHIVTVTEQSNLPPTDIIMEISH